MNVSIMKVQIQKPHRSSPKRKRGVPRRARDLVELAVNAGDPYSAAAVYDIASGAERQRLKALMFGTRRGALTLARWEHTPASVLQALAEFEDPAVKVRLNKNAGSTCPVLLKLYQEEGDRRLIRLIAGHQHAPAAILEQIAETDEDAEILKVVCTNPRASERVMRTMAARRPGAFDSAISVHPATPADVLEAIYSAGNSFVRAAIVSHSNCPQCVLDLAAQEQDATIQRHLAANARVAPAVLAGLACSSDVAVRRAAASNPILDADSALQLIQDEASAVRRAIAARQDLTPEMIACLASDPDHWVRQWIARNPMTPLDLLKKMSEESCAEVRRAVARNPACPQSLLKVLAGDINAWVRSAVAYQPNTTQGLLQTLVEDSDVDVLSGVAANPHSPQTLLQRLSRSAEADVRRGVILNPYATRRTLRPLLQDPYYLHRILLTRNAVLLDEDKWMLHDDPDDSVRFSAMRWFAGKVQADTGLIN